MMECFRNGAGHWLPLGVERGSVAGKQAIPHSTRYSHDLFERQVRDNAGCSGLVRIDATCPTGAHLGGQSDAEVKSDPLDT